MGRRVRQSAAVFGQLPRPWATVAAVAAAALRGCSLRMAVAAAVAGFWLQQAVADSETAPRASGPPENADVIPQDVHYIWPVNVWSVPLTSYPGQGAPGLEHPALLRTLTTIGERAFDRYVRDVLPRELEADPVFAEEFAQLDGSRVNQGFARWQKRVFSRLKRVPLDELSMDGKPIPRYQNISYEWPELYESKEYKLLRRHINKIASSYLSSMSKEGGDERQRMRIFIWVEVYRFADSRKPLALTGSMVTGVLFARYMSQYGRGAQKFNFEDPRGINPPFGRTHSHQPRQGEMLLFPSWSSTFITPNPVNNSNVFFNFLCWPQGGSREFDWEDDVSGDYVYRKQFSIKRPGAGKRKKGQQAKEKTEL
mmetsp:Transcript_133374/g.231664  ORF Transcript_133374/g.231664 Transcript_133374/m.231664 type:complete len:368 (-) Transcript_133374:47-1150(-)